ncbi:GHKL domain-containing protein [uncultured Robinsoniella sp.]|uniref:GHKL domain-containing protein n=1 Tax=uncultured Robinsoniella sp. TaxID=904190 RepID=UPI00374ED7DF
MHTKLITTFLKKPYGKQLKLIVVILVTVSSAVLLFYVLYYKDNKYTDTEKQPVNGILDLTNGFSPEKGLRFLTHEWEFYPGVLLSPSDFKAGPPDRYRQYISIGQYGGFETGNPIRSPHGSATYRLTINLPSPQHDYALEIPEVYSAYRLYIDNALIAQMGNPDTDQYEPGVQNRIYYFSGKGSVQIILAVTDYSYYYSGLVYPPAFGDPFSVNLRKQIELCICIAVFLISVGCLFLSFFLGIRVHHRHSLIFSALCLALSGYTIYPLIHTFFLTSIQPWYTIERLSYFLMLLLVVILQNKLCKINRLAMRMSVSASIILCVLSLVCGIFMPYWNLTVLKAWSYLFATTKWFTACYLVIIVISAIYRNVLQNWFILSGTLFYAVSILADRILPAYEPIYGGYFSEWGGAILILSLGFLLWFEILDSYKYRIILEEKQYHMEQQLSMQQEHFIQLQEKIEEVRAAKHDLRHNLRTFRTLLDTGNIQGIMDYLNQYEKQPALQIAPFTYCNNLTADAVIRYYTQIARGARITFNVSLSLPQDFPLPDFELCIILSNLLENAVEACSRQQEHEIRSICLQGKYTNDQFYMIVNNSYTGKPYINHGRFLSSKRNEYGIGISSVNKIIKNYNGICSIQTKNKEFQVSIVIPLIKEESSN